MYKISFNLDKSKNRPPFLNFIDIKDFENSTITISIQKVTKFIKLNMIDCRYTIICIKYFEKLSLHD